MQFSLLHIIYKCFLDSEASCRGRSGALLGVLRGNGPVWRQAFVGVWVRLPACVFVAGRMTQRGALAIAARCIGHRSALRRALQRLAFDGRSGCGAGLRGFPGDVRCVCPLPLGCCIGRSVTALFSGRPGKESAPVHSCVCPGALVVRGQSLWGRAERQDRGAPVPRRRAGSPLAGALLLVEQDYAAVIFAVEIDFYTAVHEELAGEGIALPVVFAAVCVHLAKGVACVGIEAGKHEAGA